MRINIKTKPWPREGARRTKEGFLFFPKWIGDEMRWLENAKWEEQAEYHAFSIQFSDWESIRWLD